MTVDFGPFIDRLADKLAEALKGHTPNPDPTPEPDPDPDPTPDPTPDPEPNPDPEPEPGDTVTPPASIDSQGGADVTRSLAEWIAGLTPGTTADLGADQGRTYRIDRQLALHALNDLTIRNAKFVIGAGSAELDHQGRSTRRHILAYLCNRLTFDNVTVVGQNTADDLGTPVDREGRATYDAKREWEHDISVDHCTHITITNLAVDAVFGDGAYIRNSTDITLDGFQISRNGRQGVAAVQGKRIKIVHGNIINSRRSGIDIEPNVTTDLVEDIEIGHMKIQSRLIPITAGGPGVVRGVHVHDIESWSQSVPILSLVPHSEGRRDGWTVENWQHHTSAGSPLALIRAVNADELTVRNITFPATPIRQMTGVELVNAGRVVLHRARFPGAAKLVNIITPAANHQLSVTDCIPQA